MALLDAAARQSLNGLRKTCTNVTGTNSAKAEDDRYDEMQPNFFGFEIEESHAHRAAAENSFEVPFAAAATEAFFRVQRNHGVAALPHALARGIPAEADAVAQRPDARELVQFSMRRGDPRGHGIGVVKNAHGNARGFALERRGKGGL